MLGLLAGTVAVDYQQCRSAASAGRSGGTGHAVGWTGLASVGGIEVESALTSGALGECSQEGQVAGRASGHVAGAVGTGSPAGATAVN